MNLKAKLYLYVNSTSQRYPNKIMKTFMIEDFFHLSPVSLEHLELRISPQIFKKKSKRPFGILSGLREIDS